MELVPLLNTKDNNMNYTANHNVSMDICNELYDSSALTLEGLSLDSLDDYAKYLDGICGLRDGAVFHIINGNEMNGFYDLYGKNAYPDDLHIVAIKLDDLVNPSAIVMNRFSFGGRWFDDMVDNNARRAS